MTVSQASLDALTSAAGRIAQGMANAAGGLVLVITFAMLAMAEAGAWKRRAEAWGMATNRLGV